MHFLALYTVYKEKQARKVWNEYLCWPFNWMKFWNVEMIYDI